MSCDPPQERGRNASGFPRTSLNMEVPTLLKIKLTRAPIRYELEFPAHPGWKRERASTWLEFHVSMKKHPKCCGSFFVQPLRKLKKLEQIQDTVCLRFLRVYERPLCQWGVRLAFYTSFPSKHSSGPLWGEPKLIWGCGEENSKGSGTHWSSPFFFRDRCQIAWTIYIRVNIKSATIGSFQSVYMYSSVNDLQICGPFIVCFTNAPYYRCLHDRGR